MIDLTGRYASNSRNQQRISMPTKHSRDRSAFSPARGQRSSSRRQFLRTAGTIGLLALTGARLRAAQASGGFLSEFFSFDREIQKFMSARNIPGGALAV